MEDSVRRLLFPARKSRIEKEEEEKEKEKLPSTFTLFPRFPKEIRDLIWKQTSQEHRIIDLWTEKVEARREERWDGTWHLSQGLDGREPFVYRSLTGEKPPIIFHVSKESRSIAHLNYALAFGTSLTTNVGRSHIKITSPPRIYINWDYDTLWLRKSGLCSTGMDMQYDGDDIQNRTAANDLFGNENIRSLAVSMDDVVSLKGDFHKLSLKELVLYWPNRQETWAKYTPIIATMFDTIQSKADMKEAFKRERAWTNSAWFMTGFQNDPAIRTEDQMFDACVAALGNVCDALFERLLEENLGLKPPLIKIARKLPGPPTFDHTFVHLWD